MASIDDKVVSMSFESSKFESGVNKTITSIEKLKKALNFPGAGKGLDQVNEAAKRIQLGHIGQGVDKISQNLQALKLVAIGVFSRIAYEAVAAGTRFVKSFTLGPLIQGFQEYATNLNSIQTILANTQASGAGLQDVNAALQELNRYSDRTIYNFSQMARNIGTFTAAGVALKPATAAIKGIANLAALSGSNSEQASTAMYQLSQAIAAGRVSLQDWNSVVNAGMGGTVFQRALANTAVAMGTLEKNSLKLVGPMKNVSINGMAFRQAITPRPGEKSWLTSDVLTKTLAQFTGDLSDAQLKAQGFNDAQIKAIQQTAKTAMHAATEVKTISQVFDVAKETMGSGWAQTFQIIFGNFNEAKKTFTDLSNAINELINANSDARNKILREWKKLGGRASLIEGIKNIFEALGSVVGTIKDAFRDIFPPVTGKNLADLTKRFEKFTETLKPSKETLNLLGRTFRGIFAIFDIGLQIVKGIFSVFSRLFDAMDGGGNSILKITAAVGDFFVNLDKALKKGKGLETFFTAIGDALVIPIKLFKALKDAISEVFFGFSPGGISDGMNEMTAAASPLQKVIDALAQTWDNFTSSLTDFGDIFRPIVDALVQGIQGLGPAVSQAISSMSFEPILQVIRTGLLGGIFLMFRKFLGKGSLIDQIGKGFGGGILANISKSFNSLSGTMQAMQRNLQAKTLKEIAIAIALLTASVVALSFVDPKKLNNAMAALAILFAQLLVAMNILGKIAATQGMIKMPVIAASLILLAVALNLLTIPVLVLSRLSWDELIKGLTGVSVLLGGLAAVSGPLSKNSAGMIRAGLGITAMAVGLNLLAVAVKIFATMNLSELAKGLGSVAISLGILAAAARVMPTGSLILMGAGLTAVAVGMNVLALAILSLGSMDIPTLAKGIAAIGASLFVIAAAMKVMPKTMAIQAAGLVLVALALNGIATALKIMGGLSTEQIAHSLIALGGALVILAIGLRLMSGSLAGAAALGIAAAGLALLVPSLVLMGRQKWSTIVKGLVALGAAIAILVVAANLLPEAVPGLLAFGAALFLIGAGVALVGIGIAGIGVGLTAIAAAGPIAFGIMTQAFEDFVKAMIENAKLLILGLLEIVQAFADTAPEFVAALVTIINAFLDAIPQLMPKWVAAINSLITAFLSVLATQRGPIIQAAADLIIALLQGLRANLPQILKTAGDVIVTFLKGLAQQIPRIVRAGVTLIVSFLNGIANNIKRVITAGANIIISIVQGIGNNYKRIVTAGAKAIASFIQGLASAANNLIQAGVSAAGKLINGIVTGILKLIDVGARAIIRFLNGIADAIDKYEPQIILAGLRIGVALVTGIGQGFAQAVPALMSKIGEFVSNAKKKLEFWHSPPEAFGESIGQRLVQGLASGISDHDEVLNAVTEMNRGVIDATKSIFEITSPSKVMHRLGREVALGLANGMKEGVEADVRQALKDVQAIVNQQIADAKQKISQARQDINKAEKGKKLTQEQIAENEKLNKVIKDQNKILNDSKRFHNQLAAEIKAHKGRLVELAREYKTTSDQLEIATNLFEQYVDQYDDLPEIPTEDAQGKKITDPLSAYLAKLKQQVGDVQAYSAVLQQLKTLGLDDKTYQMLLDAGPAAGMALAKSLLAGGKSVIDQVNTLDGQLDTAASGLADNAAKELYDVGKKTAIGFVKGLQDHKDEILKAMNDIADGMVDRIKKKLKIKSPSEIFATIGVQTMQGMAQGITDATPLATDAAETAATDAVDAVRETLAGIPVGDFMEMQPTITPVLDLTAVQADAERMKSLIDQKQVASVSFGQASSISSAQTTAEGETDIVPGGTSFRFEQNNYSPEALKEIEIYRQTRNQLSLIKSALALT